MPPLAIGSETLTCLTAWSASGARSIATHGAFDFIGADASWMTRGVKSVCLDTARLMALGCNSQLSYLRWVLCALLRGWLVGSVGGVVFMCLCA